MQTEKPNHASAAPNPWNARSAWSPKSRRKLSKPATTTLFATATGIYSPNPRFHHPRRHQQPTAADCLTATRSTGTTLATTP